MRDDPDFGVNWLVIKWAHRTIYTYAEDYYSGKNEWKM